MYRQNCQPYAYPYPYKPAGSRGAAAAERNDVPTARGHHAPLISRRVPRRTHGSLVGLIPAHPRRPWSPAARACGCFRVPPQAAAATPIVDTKATHLTRPAGRRKLARVTCERAYALY